MRLVIPRLFPLVTKRDPHPVRIRFLRLDTLSHLDQVLTVIRDPGTCLLTTDLADPRQREDLIRVRGLVPGCTRVQTQGLGFLLVTVLFIVKR